MARYRKIDVRTWGDMKFRALSNDAKLLWFYLLTNKRTTNIPGLYSIYEAEAASDIGWDLERFRLRFGEASRNGMARADWTVGLVWIPNAIKYNIPENGNVIKSWRVVWDELPECNLKIQASWELKRYIEPYAKRYAKQLPEGLPEWLLEASRNGIANQEQEQEQKQEQELLRGNYIPTEGVSVESVNSEFGETDAIDYGDEMPY